ncbi:MAG TPA: phenylalanine--tRNA ligase subunit alpha, partial [Candidatus Kapabacteria bacterium]|nr:phenylalanine--tRNA ligase subunit alpha [Candidatus Kapabacteria bacterium]
MTEQDIRAVQERLLAELASVASADALEAFKLEHLTRKGTIAQYFDRLKEVPKETKPLMGKVLNGLRQSVEAAFSEREASLGGSAKKSGPQLDLTMPPRPIVVTEPGHEHPLIKTYNEMVSIFERMGFAIESGPEVEDDEHNFGKLNFAADHPARDMQDTFFVAPRDGWTWESGEDPLVLRTHTSPVQIRVMERQQPPIRSIMPGRVYRNETLSARSGVAFFQIEGLVVDKGVTMADLK